ncbi:hypothetical protein [Azospirillum thermophilum]|uniref:Uncharacterized protein n=1 Tax=Azospirillum thermophilum TaxID=2202148 RepID=A0A2S2CTE2_9PROT|nr:hypothetical protein [Azospirillum thermophilum]AWK87738.1 hypothetical protein DEW08_17400 [Azospirillum thermophilum]
MMRHRKRVEALHALFEEWKRKTGPTLAGFGIILEEPLELDELSVEQAAVDIAELRKALSGSPADHGPAAQTLYVITTAIMGQRPVRCAAFDSDAQARELKVINALYAIAVALAYLRVDDENADAILRRLLIHLLAGGVPGRPDAGLAALRWFSDAYIRRRWLIAGPICLREGCFAIS